MTSTRRERNDEQTVHAARSSRKLSDEHKTFVVQRLAGFDSVASIVKWLREEYQVSISRQSVRYYDPTTYAGRECPERWKTLFDATRKAIHDGRPDAQLLACYRTAHLFWSMSEHEGFCIPLIEAMWFDLPVLAYRSSAIPETLGPAGLMFTEKRWPELAALVRLLIEDVDLRDKVLAEQRTRRRDFLPEAVLPAFLDLLRTMMGEASPVRAAS